MNYTQEEVKAHFDLMATMTREEWNAYNKALKEKENRLHPMLTVGIEMLRKQTELLDLCDGYERLDENTVRCSSMEHWDYWDREDIWDVCKAYGLQVWYEVEEDDDEDEWYHCYVGVEL